MFSYNPKYPSCSYEYTCANIPGPCWRGTPIRKHLPVASRMRSYVESQQDVERLARPLQFPRQMPSIGSCWMERIHSSSLSWTAQKVGDLPSDHQKDSQTYSGAPRNTKVRQFLLCGKSQHHNERSSGAWNQRKTLTAEDKTIPRKNQIVCGRYPYRFYRGDRHTYQKYRKRLNI